MARPPFFDLHSPASPWSRRRFCVNATIGTLATTLLRATPAPALSAGPTMTTRTAWTNLLLEWSEAMRAQLIVDPTDPTRHGALACPACGHIHGRCMDAAYPFFKVAKLTGDLRFVEAGRAVMGWAEANVSQPDGSWTVVADPKSWAGISIFGAIALAETLHHHGDLLDEPTRHAWTHRLRRAAKYIHRSFTIDFTNINYPATAVYGLHLFGTILNEPAYLAHARTLATQIPAFLTSPHSLLLGEGKPSHARSARGFPAVDLGYNVEESLVALSLYAVDAGDRGLEDRLVEAWRGHLQFMLPDGGWDNSWGTRQAKWSYWGSRTSDGCQPGLMALAHRDPAFGLAAQRNFELLRACTDNGLLHGGPHYAARGAPPCIHHTFTHAKALAAALDRAEIDTELPALTALPREAQKSVISVPEIATWLVARGDWRATVTAYDFVYRADARQPTGGTVSMLWHRAIGPVCAGSMARYVKVEAYNMQDDPHGRNDVLTPRLEAIVDGQLYSQLWDLTAEVDVSAGPSTDRFIVHTRLANEHGERPEGTGRHAQISYTFGADQLRIEAALEGNWPSGAEVRLVWPVIATPTEQAEPVKRSEGRTWNIHRTGSTLQVSANRPLAIPDAPQQRWFSLTPGFCALPFILPIATDLDRTGTIELRVLNQTGNIVPSHL